MVSLGHNELIYIVNTMAADGMVTYGKRASSQRAME